jgi:hypothetical protein
MLTAQMIACTPDRNATPTRSPRMDAGVSRAKADCDDIAAAFSVCSICAHGARSEGSGRAYSSARDNVDGERGSDSDRRARVGEVFGAGGLSTLLEVDELAFGALESEQLAWGSPWLRPSEWLPQLAAVICLQRAAGRRLFLVAATTNHGNAGRATRRDRCPRGRSRDRRLPPRRT